MAKRVADQDLGMGESPQLAKRQKTAPEVEEIFSVRQLQDMLAFQQDAVQRLRYGETEPPSMSIRLYVLNHWKGFRASSHSLKAFCISRTTRPVAAILQSCRVILRHPDQRHRKRMRRFYQI